VVIGSRPLIPTLPTRPLLTLVAASAASPTRARHGNPAAANQKIMLFTISPYRWPNDLLFGGEKFSGSSRNARRAERSTSRIGIGINVNQTKMPAELAP